MKSKKNINISLSDEGLNHQITDTMHALDSIQSQLNNHHHAALKRLDLVNQTLKAKSILKHSSERSEHENAFLDTIKTTSEIMSASLLTLYSGSQKLVSMAQVFDIGKALSSTYKELIREQSIIAHHFLNDFILLIKKHAEHIHSTGLEMQDFLDQSHDEFTNKLNQSVEQWHAQLKQNKEAIFSLLSSRTHTAFKETQTDFDTQTNAEFNQMIQSIDQEIEQLHQNYQTQLKTYRNDRKDYEDALRKEMFDFDHSDYSHGRENDTEHQLKLLKLNIIRAEKTNDFEQLDKLMREYQLRTKSSNKKVEKKIERKVESKLHVFDNKQRKDKLNHYADYLKQLSRLKIKKEHLEVSFNDSALIFMFEKDLADIKKDQHISTQIIEQIRKVHLELKQFVLDMHTLSYYHQKNQHAFNYLKHKATTERKQFNMKYLTSLKRGELSWLSMIQSNINHFDLFQLEIETQIQQTKYALKKTYGLEKIAMSHEKQQLTNKYKTESMKQIKLLESLMVERTIAFTERQLNHILEQYNSLYKMNGQLSKSQAVSIDFSQENTACQLLKVGKESIRQISDYINEFKAQKEAINEDLTRHQRDTLFLLQTQIDTIEKKYAEEENQVADAIQEKLDEIVAQKSKTDHRKALKQLTKTEKALTQEYQLWIKNHNHAYTNDKTLLTLKNSLIALNSFLDKQSAFIDSQLNQRIQNAQNTRDGMQIIIEQFKKDYLFKHAYQVHFMLYNKMSKDQADMFKENIKGLYQITLDALELERQACYEPTAEVSVSHLNEPVDQAALTNLVNEAYAREITVVKQQYDQKKQRIEEKIISQNQRFYEAKKALDETSNQDLMDKELSVIEQRYQKELLTLDKQWRGEQKDIGDRIDDHIERLSAGEKIIVSALEPAIDAYKHYLSKQHENLRKAHQSVQKNHERQLKKALKQIEDLPEF